MRGHYMSVMPLIRGERYATCTVRGCSRVRRAWNKRPLIHNGGKP